MNSLILIVTIAVVVFIYDIATGNVELGLEAARKWCIATIRTVRATLECIGNCVKK